MMQVPPLPSLLISYTIFQILLSLDCRLESHSDAISPDFLYDLPDLIVARLSTGIPRQPPNVTDGSGEHYQTFNSTDFDGMKCTQLTPLKYKDSKMIHYTKYLQTRLYKNGAISSDAISPDFLYDLPDLIVARLSTGIPRLPPNVTDRSGEHYQTFNSTDFDGMKCTQLSPLKYKDSKMIHYTKYLQTRLYKNDAISSDAISPDFLYDLPDLIVARLSTGIPRQPPNVTDRSGEHYQTLNSTDFDGMKCTQLTPLQYKDSKMIHYTKYLQTRLYKNDAISSDAIFPDFLYDPPHLIVARLSTGIPLRCHLS